MHSSPRGCAPKTYPPDGPSTPSAAAPRNINNLVGALAAPGGELAASGDDGDGGTTAGIELYDGATLWPTSPPRAVAVRGLDTFTAVDLLANNGGALTLTHAAALPAWRHCRVRCAPPRTAADGAVGGGSALVERFNVTLHAECPTLRASTPSASTPKVR